MNVIVICTDTLRADYLGCYGNTWMKTPYLDRFAERSIVYENCYGESLPTVQARRIWFTGRSIMPFEKGPQPKGVYPPLAGWMPLKETDVALAETLKERGYYTGLITDLWHYFKPAMNLHRGFSNWQFIRGQEMDPWRTGNKDLFDPKQHIAKHLWTPFFDERVRQYLINTQDFHSEEDYFCARTFRTAVKWLEHNVNRKPFFLWVDTFDPHEPFDCPKEYAQMYFDKYPCERYIYAYGADFRKVKKSDIPAIKGVYCGLCSLVDRWAGHLLDSIERLGLFEDTLVVFTSDHGTEFYEHGELQKHPHLLHHQVVRLPMIVHHPKEKLNGQRVNGLVSALDFMPTFMNFLKEKPEQRLEGKDFLALATGAKTKIHDYVVSGYGRYGSVRTLDWNYIFPVEKMPPKSKMPKLDEKKLAPDIIVALQEKLRPPCLYDLRNDFDETRDVIKQHPDVAARLRKLALKKWPKAPI